MREINQVERDPLYVVSPSYISPKTIRFGKILVWSSFFLMMVIGIIQILYNLEKISFGFNNWRPLLYSYILWAIAIGYSRVLIYGERGKRNLFIFPAVMFIISIVIFPMLFGLYISFTDWNLSSLDGRKFNGLDNFYQMMSDPYYWNSLKNMIYYILAVLVEFAIAFLLALLLNSQIKSGSSEVSSLIAVAEKLQSQIDELRNQIGNIHGPSGGPGMIIDLLFPPFKTTIDDPSYPEIRTFSGQWYD